MKTLLAIVALVGIVGVMGVEVTAQTAPPFIWHRVCDIEPGQGVAAAALAREFRAVANRDGSPNGRGGMIAFRSIMVPNNRMHFMQFHPDLGTWQSRREANFASPEFREAFRKTQGVFVGSSCQDSISRVVP